MTNIASTKSGSLSKLRQTMGYRENDTQIETNDHKLSQDDVLNFVSISRELTSFAVNHPDKMVRVYASKIAGSCMLMAHTGEPEIAEACRKDIAEDFAKFNARVSGLRAGAGQ